VNLSKWIIILQQDFDARRPRTEHIQALRQVTLKLVDEVNNLQKQIDKLKAENPKGESHDQK